MCVRIVFAFVSPHIASISLYPHPHNPGIHPTTIISGYRMALKQAVKHIKNNLIVTADTLGDVNLINSAKTSMSSKILGPESEFFARMAVDAVKSVKMPAVINDKKTFKVSE